MRAVRDRSWCWCQLDGETHAAGYKWAVKALNGCVKLFFRKQVEQRKNIPESEKKIA